MTDKPSSTPLSLYTRRRLLGAAVTAGGAVAGMMALPPNIRRALAEPRSNMAASLHDIKHVVLLMQENRSFDHYFGTMSGVMGYSDPHAMTLPNGRSIFYQPTDTRPEGYLLPFHLDTRTTSAQYILSTGHGWDVQHASWNNGKMDNWLGAHYKYDGNKENVPIVMGYYEEEDIPFHRALASAFTICDRYHCSMLGPTGPNRFYWETGMIDPNGQGGGPMLSNEGFVHRWKTYAEYLTEAGVSWKHYHMKGGMKSQANWCEGFQNLTEASPLFHPSQPVEEGQF
jgi:phospholipase C